MIRDSCRGPLFIIRAPVQDPAGWGESVADNAVGMLFCLVAELVSSLGARFFFVVKPTPLGSA